jgi:hypothetical protein
MRDSAEGKVKAYLNAVDRKSVKWSRTEMPSVLIDSLMAGGKGPFAPRT